MKEVVEEVKEAVKSWAEQGKAAGLRVAALLSKGESVMQETILGFAAKIAGKPAALDWLTGWALAFTDPNTAKVRKSEAKAIFEAYARTEKESTTKDDKGQVIPALVARIVSLDKDGNPVSESKTCVEWLEEHKGSYNSLLKLARELAPKATSNASKTGEKASVQKMGKKTFTKAMESMMGADNEQADKLFTAAAKRISAQPGFEAKVIGHIVGLCNEIKTKSNDVRYLDGVAQIIDVISGLTQKTAGTGTVVALPAPATIPAPAAEAPQAAMEVQKAA